MVVKKKTVFRGVKRYRPEWKATGTKRWQGFPNTGSFGERKSAEAFVNKTRKSFRVAERKGRFRIRVIMCE